MQTTTLSTVRNRKRFFLQPPVRITGLSVWYSKTDFQWSLTSSAKHTVTVWCTSRQAYFSFFLFNSTHPQWQDTLAHMNVLPSNRTPPQNQVFQLLDLFFCLWQISFFCGLNRWGETLRGRVTLHAPSQISLGKLPCRNEYWPCK